MKRRIIIGAAVAIVLAIPVALAPRSHNSSAGIPLTQNVYVWQRQWNPAVGEAIQRARDTFPAFYVFAGELDFRQNKVVFNPTPIDWALLNPAGTVTPVLRATTAFARALSPPDATHVADDFLAAVNAIQADAAGAPGISINALQVDCDCPTGQLAPYADFLRALRNRLPGKTLSVTVLPTWLASRDFAALAQDVDYLVLQVHGTEMPRNITDAVVLCDAARAQQYVRQIDAFGRDFYVALPTYTYEALFAPNGELTGIVSEGPSVPRTGQPHRFLSADPAQLAGLVSLWQGNRPRHMRGLLWFRLPVEGDRNNWPWPVLQTVMRGVTPETRLSAEVRSPHTGLHELWISSTGSYAPRTDVRVTVHHGAIGVKASDAVNGFRLSTTDSSLVLEGPAPVSTEPLLAGWWVTDAGSDQTSAFTAGEVEILR